MRHPRKERGIYHNIYDKHKKRKRMIVSKMEKSCNSVNLVKMGPLAKQKFLNSVFSLIITLKLVIGLDRVKQMNT